MPAEPGGRRDRQRVESPTSASKTPQMPLGGAPASAERFRAAVEEAKIGPDKDIPHITPEVIVKYITNLQLLGLV
jgi:thioester reductase-like protein